VRLRAPNFRADDDAIDGLCFNQGETNDSLRVDIPKTDVRPMMRRKEGAKYVITWKAESMDVEPMQKVVNQALGESKIRP